MSVQDQEEFVEKQRSFLLMRKGKCLRVAMPQGSVATSHKYCLHSKLIAVICQHHILHYHCYVDDNCVYIETLSDIGACICVNMTMLNQAFNRKHQLKVTNSNLSLEKTVHVEYSVNNLGV